MTGRRTTNSVQGGDGRIQGGARVNQMEGGDRRDLEQEEPGGTQAAAMMVNHGGADEGRSHGGGRADGSRGPRRRRDMDVRSEAGVTEDRGEAEEQEEPDRVRGMEGQGAVGGVESRGGGWSTTD